MFGITEIRTKARMEAAERHRYAVLLAKRMQDLSTLVSECLQHNLESHDEATARSTRITLARVVRELALIDAAYERLGNGSYGVCVDCVGPIEADRLLPYPEAARCASCQTLFAQAHPDTVP
jgi:RNA polymerase-binding transcription factor DksA